MDPLTRNKFNVDIEGYREYKILYTDASKVEQRVGLGIYAYDGTLSFLLRLPDMMNICDAELTAIYKSMIFCMERGWKKNLILTDSKSAIDKIRKIFIDIKTNEIMLKV